jgi:hypothetical protein
MTDRLRCAVTLGAVLAAITLATPGATRADELLTGFALLALLPAWLRQIFGVEA